MIPLLRPNWTTLASVITEPLVSPTSLSAFTVDVPLCRHRPLVEIIVDGTAYFSNGWNRPFYADINAGKLFPLGAPAPVTFDVGETTGASTFALGHVRTYYLAFRNDDRSEETAPQFGDVVDDTEVAGITHTMLANGDRVITWQDPLDGRWTHAAIYVRRPNSDDYVKLAYVTIATATYTDTTTDANLSTAILDTYVDRFRSDYPPKFKVIGVHQGRTIGITGKDANFHFSQEAHPTGELTQTDIPAGNVAAIEADDRLGEIVTFFSHYDATVFVKRRGCYLMEGDSPANWTWRRMYEGRGALSARSWCSVHSAFVLLDELGLYAWTPDAQPLVLGADENSGTLCAVTPIWQRINRDAADMIHLTHKESLGFVEARIPLDRSPIADKRVRWNLRDQRYESVDDLVSLAADKLEDSSAIQHDMSLDDLGLMEEEDVGVADGLADGDASTTVAGAGALGVIDVAPGTVLDTDSLEGAEGTPSQRRNASGTLLDANRVYSVDAPESLTLLYWCATTPATPQTLDVGAIAGVAEMPHWDFGTSDKKVMQDYRLRFVPQDAAHGMSPMLKVYSAPDERALTLRRTVDMTSDRGFAVIPCWDRGFKMRLRFEAHRAGDAFFVPALTAELYQRRLRL